MSKPTPDFIPPQNLEAEQSVIGCIFRDDDAYHEVVDVVKPSDFYTAPHQLLFLAIRSLRSKGDRVDIVSVVEKLRGRHKLEAVGGEAYVRAIATSEPSAANVKYHAQIVRDKSIRRQVIDLAGRMVQQAGNSELETGKLLAMAQTGAIDLLQDSAESTWTPYWELVGRVSDKIEEAKRQGRQLLGLPTGIPTLDSLICGLMPTDLIVIGARPSIGKTAFLQQIAEHTAARQIPVAIFSLEMAEEPFGMRAIQSRSKMTGYTLRTGNYDREIGGERIGQAVKELALLPIFVNDKTGWHYAEIQAQARRLILQEKVGLVMVDYIGIVKGDMPENRVRELGTIAQGLKELAKRHQIPVVVLSQLSRALEKDKRRPTMIDLRDSGEIEQIADVVILLHRIKSESEAVMIVDKSRNLQTGDVKVHWDGATMRYSEVDTLHQEGGHRDHDND